MGKTANPGKGNHNGKTAVLRLFWKMQKRDASPQVSPSPRVRTCFLPDLECDGNNASLRGQKGRGELRAKGGVPSFAPEAMKNIPQPGS